MKKIISYCLIFTMILSSFIWADGGKQAKIQAVENVPEGYTAIYDISDLYAIRNDLSGKYILMNDIDMTEDTAPGGAYDTGNGWVPIDNFTGELDGNGYYIKGMQIYGKVASGCVGLFGQSTRGNIYRLGMVDVNIDVSSDEKIYCGAIAGQEYGREVKCCFATGNITIQQTTSKDILCGGLLGYGFGSISDSYNGAEIKLVEKEGTNASEYIGGLVGCWYGDDDITNCYNYGQIKEGVGKAVCGQKSSSYSQITNCFYLQGSGQGSYGTPLTETQMKNKNFFTNYDFDSTWEMDEYSNYLYPQLTSCMQKRIQSLTIETAPKKTVYKQGESLDITGCTLKVKYEDGYDTTILLSDSMLGNYDMMRLGEQNIPIYKGNKVGYLPIVINEIPVESVALNMDKLSINKGYTETLSASVLPSNASTTQVTWASSDESVVTVDSAGKVMAKGKGTAVITATANNGVVGECNVTVTIPCVILQLDSYDLTVNKGEIFTPGFTMSPVDSTDQVSWMSGDESILHIDNDNNFVGISAGTTTATAKTDSGVTQICTVTVLQDISEFTVLGIKDLEYTGKALIQNLTITNGSKELRPSADYEINYIDNIQIGKATIQITGKTPYKGTITRGFNVLEPVATATPKPTSTPKPTVTPATSDDGNPSNVSGTDSSSNRSNTAVTKKTCAKPKCKVTKQKKGKRARVILYCATKGVKLYYTTNGKTPSTQAKRFKKPFILKRTTRLKVIAVRTNYNNSSLLSKKLWLKSSMIR